MAMVTEQVRFRALRGATTVAIDDPGEITVAVRELVATLMHANALAADEIVSAIFSATPDLRRLYPAAVAREMGWQEVPMLCVSEMQVDGAPARCVRVLLHVGVAAGRTLRPVYLRDACCLRPDLAVSA